MSKVKMSKRLAKQLLMVPTTIIDKNGDDVGTVYEGDEFEPIGTFRHAVSIAEKNNGRVAKILGLLIQEEARRVLVGGKKK